MMYLLQRFRSEPVLASVEPMFDSVFVMDLAVCNEQAVM